MRHALPGIAGDDEDVLVPGVAADEAAVVERVEHLA